MVMKQKQDDPVRTQGTLEVVKKEEELDRMFSPGNNQDSHSAPDCFRRNSYLPMYIPSH